MAINVPQVEQYIRQAAQKRGIDPDVAVRVARSEGLAPGVWQSNVVKNGKRETSYGPFQLLVGGGLGDKFMEQTGMDPRDPSTVNAQVDFALDQAAQGGWSPWYGAAKVGVSDWTGLQGANPSGVQANLSPQAQDFVKNNPQPGGFGPGIDDPNSPKPSIDPTMTAGVFGSMAPSPVPSDVASYATSDDPKSLGDRMGDASKAWDKEMNRYKPPRLNPMGNAGDSGNALLKVLNSPNAADMFLKKRLGGVT